MNWYMIRYDKMIRSMLGLPIPCAKCLPPRSPKRFHLQSLHSMRSVLCQCFASLFSLGKGWVHDQNRLYVNTCALKRKVFHSVCQKLCDLSTCGLWHELVLPLWQLNMSFVSQENMTIFWNIHQQGGDDFNDFQWKFVDMIPRCYNILFFQTGYTVRAGV